MTCASLCQGCYEATSPHSDSTVKSPKFEHPALLAEFQRLGLDQVKSKTQSLKAAALPQVDDGPPTKRRKINNNVSLFEEITADLYELLGAQRASDLAGLHQLVEYVAPPRPLFLMQLTLDRTCFEALKSSDQCKAVEYLGRIPCGLSGKLSVTRENGKIVDSKCLICDGVELPETVNIQYDAAACSRISK